MCSVNISVCSTTVAVDQSRENASGWGSETVSVSMCVNKPLADTRLNRNRYGMFTLSDTENDMCGETDKND